MSEFIGNDFGILKNHTSTTATTGPSAGKNILEILLHNVNPRNYDLEYSLRRILHHRGAAVELYENIHNGRGSRPAVPLVTLTECNIRSGLSKITIASTIINR